MKAFCIFDDFPDSCIAKLEMNGIEVTSVAKGQPRPTEQEMRPILEKNDIVIIGTSQKILERMWDNITTPRIIATASVGIDHIHVPENKKHLLTVLNTPDANTQSVAEYTVGAILMARKRIIEGNMLYAQGLDNKKLIRKPEDIQGTTIGLVGAGRISTRIMELLKAFNVSFLCYTKNPSRHFSLREKYDVDFVSLEQLAERSDIISVNVPNDSTTVGMIDADIIERMKDSCIYISVSRAQVTDNQKLFEKAKLCPNFYAVLDLDIIPEYVGMNACRNIVITPHIAGGTIESRNRMFSEVTQRIVKIIEK